VLVLDMIEIIPSLGKYNFDTWRILPVKCYIDNYVRFRSCIRNINSDKLREFQWTKPLTFSHSIKPMDVDDWWKTVEKKLQVLLATTKRRFCLQHISWSDLLLIGGMRMLEPMRS
jgi:hypothetical protein